MEHSIGGKEIEEEIIKLINEMTSYPELFETEAMINFLILTSNSN